jgi:hypothetical protein
MHFTHHIYPKSGWVKYWIRNSKDMPAIIKVIPNPKETV